MTQSAAKPAEVTTELTQAQVDQVWESVSKLGEELPLVRDRVISLWDKVSDLLEGGSFGPNGNPQRRAEYLVLEVSVTQLLERTTELLKVGPEVNARNTSVDAHRKMMEFASAAENVDQDMLKQGVFEPDVRAAYLSDVNTVKRYGPNVIIGESSVLITAYAPLLYVRDILAGYADEKPAKALALEAAIALIKTVGVDFLAKANPLIGPAIALAEVLKSHAERRANEFKAGINERDRFLNLESAVAEGKESVAWAERDIEEYRKFAENQDREFNNAFVRGTAMMKVISKKPE
jgi:hypothetical protein